jgi:hypothetical protein
MNIVQWQATDNAVTYANAKTYNEVKLSLYLITHIIMKSGGMAV